VRCAYAEKLLRFREVQRLLHHVLDGSGVFMCRYHDNYYGAFVRDPDGINIEAVCNAAP
jgi:catechol 2,3-dioxygenase-like lactoylglutathione lyase family enzyme